MKNQFIGMNKKQKLRIKIRQMNTDILSNETLELRNYLYQFICIKAMMWNELMLEDIIYLKELLIIIASSLLEKRLWQSNRFSIKRYKEIRKLTTGKTEDYTDGCL